jgi:anaerobic selenocysteine-containing dehydrogenase
VVLPAASPLQKEDIGIPWGGNYLLYKPRVLPMEGMERSDYDIFSELASLMGGEGDFTQGLSESRWIDRFIQESEIGDAEAFKEAGIYFGKEQERSGLGDFTADPGRWPLKTKSGKVELESPLWKGFARPNRGVQDGRPPRSNSAGLAEGEQSRPSAATQHSNPSGDFDFLLISPKERLRVHSQWGYIPEQILQSLLVMNDAQAAKLGLDEGQEIELSSATGSTRIRLSLSSDIMPGVVSIYEGSWCGDEGGKAVPGAANYLTSTLGTKESVSCVMHGIPVRLRSLAGFRAASIQNET